MPRSASGILKEQHEKSKAADKAMIENLHFVKDLGRQSQQALEAGDLRRFAELMRVHWERNAHAAHTPLGSWYSHVRLRGCKRRGFRSWPAGQRTVLVCGSCTKAASGKMPWLRA